MTDIIESLEPKAIRPLDVPGRTPVYVFCTSYKVMRQLSRLADVAYTSQKANYTLLYVNENDVPTLLEKLKTLKFVKKVRVGHLKEMNQNFSEAFEKTNAEVRQELEKAKD